MKFLGYIKIMLCELDLFFLCCKTTQNKRPEFIGRKGNFFVS